MASRDWLWIGVDRIRNAIATALLQPRKPAGMDTIDGMHSSKDIKLPDFMQRIRTLYLPRPLAFVAKRVATSALLILNYRCRQYEVGTDPAKLLFPLDASKREIFTSVDDSFEPSRQGPRKRKSRFGSVRKGPCRLEKDRDWSGRFAGAVHGLSRYFWTERADGI